MDYLSTLISNTGFMPHGHCFFWRADVLWLHVGANATIAVAYFIIPMALFLFARRNKLALPHKDLIYLFVTFIFFCGLSHAAEIITTWIPVYVLEGWIKAATAAISLITALVIIPKLPELLLNPLPNQKNAQLKEELRHLEIRIEQMNSVYEASLDREDRITQLKQEVNEELISQGRPARYKIFEARH